jgi:4-amino-4-deoxy-L-arabinose transferase-like glycosyltransferase
VTAYRVKVGLVYAIIAILVLGQTALFIGLRHITGPAAYTHDGGVIQTEATIEYLLTGINPYAADYLDTPMAAWGTEYRTALYHYPYLPWTFIFSTPFYLLSNATLGWFDQRFVYLLLFAVTLVLGRSLARRRDGKLAVVMLMGLNPVLASDVIFGQNDSFVLFWVVLALWLLRLAETRGATGAVRPLSAAALGLACASKPTAWFLVPFWLLYLLRDELGFKGNAKQLLSWVRHWLDMLARHAWPLVLMFVLVVGPWFVWDPAAIFDDVWRWSAGTTDMPYQIRGWGLSNFILALNLVPDRLAYWPFWIPEALITTPLLIILLWRQARRNTLGTMLYGYVVVLFGFFYVSRFLNENYLGYLLALFALAHFAEGMEQDRGESG